MTTSAKALVGFVCVAILGDTVSGKDWPQWGGSSHRNNVAAGKNIPHEWNIGDFHRNTNKWDKTKARNVKWVAELGSQTYGSPVVSGGRIFVGTNNGGAYIKRYSGDLGCMLCFRETDGEFQWQYSSEKLPTGRVHDMPEQGIVTSPLVEGNRMWFVNNRGEVVCADTEGFYDDEDDGPEQAVLGRLFTVPAKVTNDTKWGYWNSSYVLLRSIAEQSGLDLPSYLQTARDSDGSWIILDGQGTKTRRVARLSVTDNKLRLSRIVVQEDNERFKELFTAEADLLNAVSKGKLTRTIRHLFGQAGAALPANINLLTLKPGGAWSFKALVEGRVQGFEMHVEGENLTAYKLITPDDRREADVVWVFDMMKELGVRQHNMATCSVTSWENTLFVCTSNGVDEAHINIPAADAPSFIAIDKRTGRVLWADNSPGMNIMHGQWSSPAVGVLDGVPQVIFAGGDGWVYSFRADRWKNESPELLWKFDANPKDSKWMLGGRGTRNSVVAVPVIYDGLVYLVCGQDPEHGEGDGHLWCIDPAKRGDVSTELVFGADGKQLPHFRDHAAAEWAQILYVSDRKSQWDGISGTDISAELRARFQKAGFALPKHVSIDDKGESRFLTAEFDASSTESGRTTSQSKVVRRFRLDGATWEYSGSHRLSVFLETHARVVQNPNSAAVWHYEGSDWNGDGKFDGEEKFHRSISTVAIRNDLLFAPDLSGYVHCLDAKTGKAHWTCDLFAACWSSPLIVNDKVYIADEDGEVAIFQCSADRKHSLKSTEVTNKGGSRSTQHTPLREVVVNSSVYATPVVANNVLYIADRSRLYAIAADDE